MNKPRFLFINVYDTYALGPRYIAALLKKHGFEVFLLNFKLFTTKAYPIKEYKKIYEFMRKKYKYFIVQHIMRKKYFLPSHNPYTEKELSLLFEFIKDYNPDYILFSTHSANEAIVRFLTKEIKKYYPKKTVIWGGVYPTYMPEKALEDADIVCIGEGEYPTLELAKSPNKKDIKNLYFKHNGKIIKNPVRPLIENLDELPFPEYGDYELFIEYDNIMNLFTENPQMRNDHIYVQTSRGCPYSCSYCHNSVLKKRIYPKQNIFRQRSVKNVIEQVRFYIEKYNIKYVIFSDEIFIKNEKWIDEFVKEYKNIRLPFTGYCHPCLTTENMLLKLREVGMNVVTMGIQSGSERILKEIYHRYFGLKPILKMIEIFNRLQFDIVRYDLIVNNPYEDEEDYKQTLELLLKINHPFDLAIFGLEYFPFTELYDMPRVEFKVPENIRESWITLFLMTTIQGFPKNIIKKISQNKFLMEHPEILRTIGSLFRNDDIPIDYFGEVKPYKFSITHALKNIFYTLKR